MKMRGRKIPKVEGQAMWAGIVLLLSAFLQLTEGLNPFVPAVAAAALCAGIHPWVLTVFAGMGAILSGQYSILIAFSLCLGTGWAGRKWTAEVRSAIAAMAGALAGGAILRSEVLALLASAVLACALSPALVCGFQIQSKRKILAPEEKISLAVAGLMALAGLSCSHPAGKIAVRCIAAALTVAAARESSGAGALVGLLSGAGCLCGGNFAVMLGVGGAAAGVLRAMKRGWAALGFAAACGLAHYCLGDGEWLGLATAALGASAFCLLGEKRMRMAGLLVREAENAGEKRRLRNAQANIRQMHLALSECARTCAEGGVADSGCSMTSVMRERLCEGCGGFAQCWNGQSPEAGRLFSSLAARLSTGENLDELPPDQVRFCRRAPHIARRLAGIQAMTTQRQAAQRERMLAAQMSAAPLEKASILLQELEQDLAREDREDRHGVQCAAGMLDRQGETVNTLSVSMGPEMAVDLCGAAAGWDGERIKRVAGLLSDALGGNYVARSPDQFVRTPTIRIEAGVFSREASPGSPCGDRALCAPLGDGKTALILSDGMGRGADAADESRCVVTLLHRLLLAGAQVRSAIDAVNSMMRLRSGERFATLDLCIIDPYRGEASFYKLGACLSVLVRRRVCLRVEGGKLPPGVVEPAEPSVFSVRLRGGDAIVMVSDGVADFAREGQEDWLTTTLSTLSLDSAEKMAHALVQAAVRREKGKPGDDMTALCARIIVDR